MARFLGQGRDANLIAADGAKVGATVEGILAGNAEHTAQANVRGPGCGGRNAPYGLAAE